MSGPVKRVTHNFPIPREVRAYLQGNPMEVTWSFIDPTDALVRLLVASPLAGTSLSHYIVTFYTSNVTFLHLLWFNLPV